MYTMPIYSTKDLRPAQLILFFTLPVLYIIFQYYINNNNIIVIILLLYYCCKVTFYRYKIYALFENMTSKDLWMISKQFADLLYNENNEAKITIFNSVIDWIHRHFTNSILLRESIIYNEQPCGNTPLHFILMVEAPSYGLVEGLLSLAPEVAKVRNRAKQYPLHVAAEHKASYEDITAIFEAFPSAIKKRDCGGRLPLHLSCYEHVDTKICFKLARVYPEAIKKTDNARQLPLHCACVFANSFESIELIEMFLKAYPKGKNIRTKNIRTGLRFLPTDQLRTNHNYLSNIFKNNLLHEAVRRGRSNILLDFILLAFPNQYMERDDKGRIPLHYACESCASNANENVMFLLKTYGTRYLKEKDASGITPIDVLRKRAKDEDVVNTFPFHRFARTSKFLYYKGLSVFVTVYPNSLHQLDNSGLLPFHYACLNSHASIEALMWFIKRTPQVFIGQI
jgi:ankyrin repeat protein